VQSCVEVCVITHLTVIRHCRIRKQVRGGKKKNYSLRDSSRSVDICIISRVDFIAKFSSYSLRDERKQECRICKYEIDELGSIDINNPHDGWEGAAPANYEFEDEVA
jgi:hypothetical protein